MKFTVFGSSGFIGSHLVGRLMELGHDVDTPNRQQTVTFDKHLGHVVYAIGLTADFRNQPFATVNAHVSVLARILEHAEFSSLLYLSSTRVYGLSGSGHEDDVLHVQPENPSDLYNLSKLMGESLCHQSKRSCVKVVRLSNVVGPYREDSGNFVNSLMAEAQRGKIILHSSLDSEKDYVHLEDVLHLLPLIAGSGRWRTYNIASGCNTSHASWVNSLQSITGCEVVTSENVPLFKFPLISVARIQEEFGFTPRAIEPDISSWMPRTSRMPLAFGSNAPP